MKILLAILLLASASTEVTASQTKTQEIWCRGIIEEFVRKGSRDEVWNQDFDITWVRVKEPEKYAGVRIPMYTLARKDSSPLGKVGELVRFTSFTHILDEAKKNKEVPNQSSQPTPSGRG